MLFPTYSFFLVFVPILTLNWTLKRWPKIWKWFLLVVSYLFYATWDTRFLITLAFVSLVSWFFGQRITDTQNACRRKQFLTAGGVILVGTLALLKYYDFFRVSLETLLGRFGLHAPLPLLNILLPVGLSFYVLRALAYIIDVYRKNAAPLPLLDLAIYVAFFPQLLSGPIARPKSFSEQLHEGGAKTIENMHENFALILSGLFKKVVLASALSAGITDRVFAVPTGYGALETLLAVYAYAIVIYSDFSGYSDMAAGIAGLMGFRSPLNFRQPYGASSLKDFWRRWHITFSEWLRDYVYIPLGGNRRGKVRQTVNSVITMIVSGFWHGVGGTYILWGAIHGLGLASQNWLTQKVPGGVSKIITFHFVCLAWIFFRAADMGDAFALLRNFANWRIGAPGTITFSLLATMIGAYLFILRENYLTANFIKIQNKLPLVGQIAFISAILVVMIEAGPDIVPPFIYFQF